MPQIRTWRMEQEQPCTLEQFLRTEKNVSRRLLTKLKRTNGLWCNGTPIRSIDLVRFGDVIVPEMLSVVANAVRSVPICFETADFVAYHKPPICLCISPKITLYRCLLGRNTGCPTKTKRRNVPCRKYAHGEWSRNSPAHSNSFSEPKKTCPGDS